MKLSVLAVSAVALGAIIQGPAMAQMAPQAVTMQPIANPPEKPMKTHRRKAKHNDAAPAKATSDASPSTK